MNSYYNIQYDSYHDPRKWRIAFFGSTEFSAFTLNAMLKIGIKPIIVFSKPHHIKKRGRYSKPTIISQIAINHDLVLYTPEKWNKDIHCLIQQAKLDLVIVVAYGLILPLNILNSPKFGCLNIHPSALPRWRGAAPIQRAIQSGDTKSAVSIIRMDAGIDTGNILWQQLVNIPAEWNAGDWHDYAGKIGAKGLINLLFKLPNVKSLPQDTMGVCYANMITRHETQIDFYQSATNIINHIRAFSPKPGAWCLWQGKRLCFLSAIIINQYNKDYNHKLSSKFSPGQVCDQLFTIQTAQGRIRPVLVQLEGRVIMSINEFLRGHSIILGELLFGLYR